MYVAILRRRIGSLTKIREKDRLSTYKDSGELYTRTVGLRTVVCIRILMEIWIVREQVHRSVVDVQEWVHCVSCRMYIIPDTIAQYTGSLSSSLLRSSSIYSSAIATMQSHEDTRLPQSTSSGCLDM